MATPLMNLKKRWVFTGLSVVVVAVILILVIGGGSGSSDIPTYPVKRGDFRVTITETGELRAQNSVVITSPTVRVSAQIVFLAPKGTEVKAGDTLIVLDGTELQQTIDDKKNELEIAIANLNKSRSSMASNMADLNAQLESAQASYRIAELRLQQMQFEADVVKEEQELSLQQSKISLDQAKERIEQQKIMNEAELKTLELRVVQARNDLDKAKRDLSKLTITAPQPGLVVYKKIWKGGEFGEVKLGDTPWRGQALLELPDLSVMEVETAVNEVDVSKVEVGQKATIVPDAFPEMSFKGHVIDVAGLARMADNTDADVKVFDVVVQLDSTDSTLKPGMTVSTTITINEVPDTLSIPLDAVFTVGGKPVVYRLAGGFKQTPVTLGIRNDNYVVVQSGLQAGDRVALVDPTKPYEAAPPTTTREAEAANNTPAQGTQKHRGSGR